MKRITGIAWVIISMVALPCFAQTDYFPIGAWAIVRPGQNITTWSHEREMLDTLCLNNVEAFCTPHDSSWLMNVCDPSGGEIRISTQQDPGYATPLWSVIQSWAVSGLPGNYQEIIRAHLDADYNSYALHSGWASMFIGNETNWQ